MKILLAILLLLTLLSIPTTTAPTGASTTGSPSSPDADSSLAIPRSSPNPVRSLALVGQGNVHEADKAELQPRVDLWWDAIAFTDECLTCAFNEAFLWSVPPFSFRTRHQVPDLRRLIYLAAALTNCRDQCGAYVLAFDDNAQARFIRMWEWLLWIVAPPLEDGPPGP
ncbi:hypothetical protein BDV96DRAFT_591766 [Lophiotrema nucula]|uniref:Uncharacterized protein n=1 Tax=Lophiotrema nucula TaxID=690887 RepID=A0A6A5YIF0_9PLEO|nr:hypothetical protein BDV96DRAFT_591766 [Lophiotrema nucula]